MVNHRFGGEHHAVDTGTSVAVNPLYVIYGRFGGAYFYHAVLIYERTRMQDIQGVAFASVSPTVEIGTVCQNRNGITAAENQIFGRTYDIDFRYIDGRRDRLAERHTFGYATDAGHQRALYTVARFKILDIQGLVVFGSIG